MNRVIKNPFARMQKVAVETLRSLCNFSFVKLKGNNLMIPICVSLFCLSCSNKNEADMNNQSLEGTKWKLEGIWYEESNVFKAPKLDCKECYMLTFDTETTAHSFLPDKTISLVIAGRNVQSKVPDGIEGKGGGDPCYYEAGIIDDEGYNDIFPAYYQFAFIGVQYNYSISETEMKLYFYEPIGMADWEGLGIEVPVHSLNSYLLFKKVTE